MTSPFRFIARVGKSLKLVLPIPPLLQLLQFDALNLLRQRQRTPTGVWHHLIPQLLAVQQLLLLPLDQVLARQLVFLSGGETGQKQLLLLFASQLEILKRLLPLQQVLLNGLIAPLPVNNAGPGKTCYAERSKGESNRANTSDAIL